MPDFDGKGFGAREGQRLLLTLPQGEAEALQRAVWLRLRNLRRPAMVKREGALR